MRYAQYWRPVPKNQIDINNWIYIGDLNFEVTFPFERHFFTKFEHKPVTVRFENQFIFILLFLLQISSSICLI